MKKVARASDSRNCLKCLSPAKRRRLLERIGVEGSVPRRVLALMEQMGFVLLGAEVGHLSRTVLRFDEGNYLTTVVIEDTERPQGMRARKGG